MKKIITGLFVFAGFSSWSQQIVSTDHFTVTGLITKELIFTVDFLGNFQFKSIPDVDITNHKGEKKSTAKNLNVVSVKDLLKDVELTEDNPKRYSEYYLTFVASDNYKVVYSWNEVFNSATGENIFIVVNKDGKKMREMKESILVITPTDYNTGRRYMKGLSKIIFERIEKESAH